MYFALPPSCFHACLFFLAIGPLGSADLRFISPQPVTSFHCKAMHMALMNCMMCPVLISLMLVMSTHRGMARLSWICLLYVFPVPMGSYGFLWAC